MSNKGERDARVALGKSIMANEFGIDEAELDKRIEAVTELRTYLDEKGISLLEVISVAADGAVQAGLCSEDFLTVARLAFDEWIELRRERN